MSGFPFGRAAAIELLVCDVDGVLTDGGITIDDRGIESKRFDVRDGHGIKLLQRAGVRVALLTGRTSRVVRTRAGELGIRLLRQGCVAKGEGIAALAQEAGVPLERCAMVGDDLVDLPAMARCALAFAPADAHPAVRRRADWVSRFPGGGGAVREACEGLILARGAWAEVIGRPYGVSPEECGWRAAGEGLQSGAGDPTIGSRSTNHHAKEEREAT